MYRGIRSGQLHATPWGTVESEGEPRGAIFKDNRFSLALDTPLYQQVYAHLRASILSGELKGGMKLPSTRALADELSVSRNTILNAYGQLTAEGYLDNVRGSGTFVARILPDHLLRPPGQKDLPHTQPTQPGQPLFSDHARLQLTAPRMSEATPSPAGGSPRPFRFGIPALGAFPYKLWSRLVVRQARRLPASAFTYQNNRYINDYVRWSNASTWWA